MPRSGASPRRWEPRVLNGTNHRKKETLVTMLHVGMDLSRTRLDVCVLDENGTVLEGSPWAPDADGLVHLVKVKGLAPLSSAGSLRHGRPGAARPSLVA